LPRTDVRALLIDPGERLVRSLLASGESLQKLQRGLAERRTAWVAARPSALAPAAALEELAQELAAEEGRRGELLAEIRGLMPGRPGVAAEDLHVNVSRLCALVPPALAARLQQAAAAATAASRLVRAELALGARLLQFSRRAHEGLLAGIGRARDDVGGYDRGARRVHGALVGRPCATGTLVDGRM
jgi:hypothetical protein